jgi:magnesium chelatase subunit D
MNPVPMPASNALSKPLSPEAETANAWHDAELAAALVAILRHKAGGIRVGAQPGPVRDYWLALLDSFTEAPARRVPSNTPTERLLGGMDITESMRHGKPVLAQGVLAECHQRVVLLSMAERLPKEFTGHWCAALDTSEVHIARDGISHTSPASITVIALDEGIDEESPPAGLIERLGLSINLDEISIRCVEDSRYARSDIQSAQSRLSHTTVRDEDLTRLAELAASMGVHSSRTLKFAVDIAKALSLLSGKPISDEAVMHPLIRLVLLPIAQQLPIPRAEPQPPEQSDDNREDTDTPEQQTQQHEDLVQAAMADLPEDLLAILLKRAEKSRQRQSKSGNAGDLAQDKQRGRPVGVRRGDVKRGHRIDIPATLGCAAPFQTARATWDTSENRKTSLYIEPSDIRVKRFEQRKSSVMIFAVDASGSSAHQRMSEAKGAIELLLADCYSHRTEVALIAFKGDSAEILLPPTRSLVRAKRTLAQLPGGGGTPMAAALQATHELALSVSATGATPSYVLLTDGAANVARDGTKSRSAGTEDALSAAKLLANAQFKGVLVDTAVRPSPRARELSSALDATYLPLPNASAQSLNTSIRTLSVG